MEYKICLTFIFMLSVVRCYQCGKKDLTKLFKSDSDLCHGDSWTLSQTSVSFDKDNDISNVLTPSTQYSCITSNTLSLVSGGILEVKVYSKSKTKEDFLTVLVYETKDNSIVGETTLSVEENGVNGGLYLLKVVLGGVGYYDGYIMLLGKSLNSDILVGSICYSPAHEEEISEDTLTIAPHYEAPDMYALQTGSLLMYPIHPNGNQEAKIEKVENRSFWIFDREDFWTPLTISLAVIIIVIILALLSWACFALGKRKGAKQPQIVYEDVDNLPKPYVVPRVRSVYAESVESIGYGGRNNNTYSV